MSRPPSHRTGSQPLEELAVVAHELQAPIALLRSSLEQVVTSPLDEDVRRTLLSRCLEEVDRLERLVVDLLLLGRAASDDLPNECSFFDLKALVVGVIERFASRCREKDLRLGHRLSGPVSLSANEGQIERIVSNLVDNALKYTRSGGRVEVEMLLEDQEVALTVSDTGEGIPREHLEHIFRRFYRVRREGEAPSGSGLGLTIARTLAERNGGTLSVESRPGQGSRFTLRLPARTQP